ncbi:hypothetical protein [Pseudonocardia sp. NPDC049154]|uniref:hypothetical protein n=1 Tax=Pseudonocardia sp. NPDC049154 TaxID=3155501 RepID=UPI0033D902D5
MNRNALRYAVRAFTPWFLVFVTALYLAGAFYIQQEQGQALFFAGLFGGLAVMTFRWRYCDFVEGERREAEIAEYAARREAQLAEHQARLDEILQAREERQAARRSNPRIV